MTEHCESCNCENCQKQKKQYYKRQQYIQRNTPSPQMQLNYLSTIYSSDGQLSNMNNCGTFSNLKYNSNFNSNICNQNLQKLSSTKKWWESDDCGMSWQVIVLIFIIGIMIILLGIGIWYFVKKYKTKKRDIRKYIYEESKSKTLDPLQVASYRKSIKDLPSANFYQVEDVKANNPAQAAVAAVGGSRIPKKPPPPGGPRPLLPGLLPVLPQKPTFQQIESLNRKLILSRYIDEINLPPLVKYPKPTVILTKEQEKWNKDRRKVVKRETKREKKRLEKL